MLLHLFGKLFFFRNAYANKISHHRDRLTAAMRCLADDVHAAAISRRLRKRVRRLTGSVPGLRSPRLRACRQACAAQSGEARLSKSLGAIGRNARFAAHDKTLIL